MKGTSSGDDEVYAEFEQEARKVASSWTTTPNSHWPGVGGSPSNPSSFFPTWAHIELHAAGFEHNTQRRDHMLRD